MRNALACEMLATLNAIESSWPLGRFRPVECGVRDNSRQWIAADLVDQRDQPLRGTFDGDRAKFRGCLGRIAAGALGMQILGLPAEADRTPAPKYFGLALDLDRQRHEILGAVHLDKFGMEMQHNACFALAGVNAMPVFAGIE